MLGRHKNSNNNKILLSSHSNWHTWYNAAFPLDSHVTWKWVKVPAAGVHIKLSPSCVSDKPISRLTGHNDMLPVYGLCHDRLDRLPNNGHYAGSPVFYGVSNTITHQNLPASVLQFHWLTNSAVSGLWNQTRHVAEDILQRCNVGSPWCSVLIRGQDIGKGGGEKVEKVENSSACQKQKQKFITPHYPLTT